MSCRAEREVCMSGSTSDKGTQTEPTILKVPSAHPIISYDAIYSVPGKVQLDLHVRELKPLYNRPEAALSLTAIAFG